MSNSIKQFANMMISFIDKTLMPLIDTKVGQAAKALDQWTQLKTYIQETDPIQTWKLDKFMQEISVRPLNPDIKKIGSEHSSKHIPSIRSTSLYQTEPWKQAQSAHETQIFEIERKQNTMSSPYTMQSLKHDDRNGQGRVNLDSFENLLSSFRKLCTNFENNHKKLVMDREAYSH